MELWNHYTSSICSLNHFRGAKQIIRVVLACYMLCPIVVKSESCGPCQKKFVWTTAWPMEENYVTYKLIGPLIDKTQQISPSLSLSSSSPYQRNQTNSLGYQQSYFLFLSTPKDGEEGSKSVPAITEANEKFERIGFKTEVELDELPSKFEAYNNENQANNRIISLANPSYFGNISRPDYGNKNIPLSQRVVFSAHKSDAAVDNGKQHTLELVSKVKKGAYVNANGNAKSRQSPNITAKVIAKLQKNTLNLPESINKAKGMSRCPDKLHKVRRVPYDPSFQTGKPLQWGIVHHRAVAKKIHTKSKSSESAQCPKSARNTTLNSESLPTKIQSLAKSYNQSPSNILKIVKLDPGQMNNLSPTNDSSDLTELDLSYSSPFPKEIGRLPAFRDGNSSSISRFPSFPHNAMKGCKLSLNDINKEVESSKAIKSEAKSARAEKAVEINIVKNALKSGTVHKKMVGKREKLTGEKSTKKRRENPYMKEIKEKNSAQHAREVMQPRIRKILPLRYRLHSMNKLSGMTSDNNASFLSWFKDLSSPLNSPQSVQL